MSDRPLLLGCYLTASQAARKELANEPPDVRLALAVEMGRRLAIAKGLNPYERAAA